MSRPRLAWIFAILALITLVPRAASAQFSIGGFLGREFDEGDDWILFGADARYVIRNFPIVLNPRFDYHPFTGAHVIQLDANGLYPLKLVHPGKFRPYVGSGLALVHLSANGFSETKVGVNLIVGTDFIISPSSPLRLFFTNQYTVVNSFGNGYRWDFGLLYQLR